MIWPTRLRGLSDANGSWKTICISRRSGSICLAAGVVMSSPRKRIAPSVASIRRMIARDSVVLPQPDSPTSPSVSPSAIDERHVVDGVHAGHLAVDQEAPA